MEEIMIAHVVSPVSYVSLNNLHVVLCEFALGHSASSLAFVLLCLGVLRQASCYGLVNV